MKQIKYRQRTRNYFHYWGFIEIRADEISFILPATLTLNSQKDHELYTGLKDENGIEIYEGDIVYLGGYGDYTVAFPFLELYEASYEGDIGKLKGNIYGDKYAKTN